MTAPDRNAYPPQDERQVRMSSEGEPVSGGDDGAEGTDLWAEIEEDIVEGFGEDAEISVYPASDHLDVRILPRSIETHIEAEHDDVEVVPYTAFRMTVRRNK